MKSICNYCKFFFDHFTGCFDCIREIKLPPEDEKIILKQTDKFKPFDEETFFMLKTESLFRKLKQQHN